MLPRQYEFSRRERPDANLAAWASGDQAQRPFPATAGPSLRWIRGKNSLEERRNQRPTGGATPARDDEKASAEERLLKMLLESAERTIRRGKRDRQVREGGTVRIALPAHRLGSRPVE